MSHSFNILNTSILSVHFELFLYLSCLSAVVSYVKLHLTYESDMSLLCETGFPSSFFINLID